MVMRDAGEGKEQETCGCEQTKPPRRGEGEGGGGAGPGPLTPVPIWVRDFIGECAVPPACVRVAEPPSAGWRWGRGQVVASGTVVVAARAVAVAVSVRGPWLPT